MMEQFWEIYVRDISASERFYSQAIGLTTVRRHEDFAVLASDAVKIHLCRAEDAPDALVPVQGPVGSGTEFCIVVSDIAAAYARARQSGYSILEHLTDQDWGKTDFRLLDPDGAYIRVTTHRTRPNLYASEAITADGSPDKV